MLDEQTINSLGFEYKKNQLFLDTISSIHLVEEFGSPLMVLSSRRLSDNYNAIERSFLQHFRKLNIAYALKANYNPAVISILGKMGAGSEVMSGLELFLAIKSGILPPKIVFNGPSKLQSDIEKAIELNIGLINVESFEELKDLSECTWKSSLPLIGVRIAPKLTKEVRRNALIQPYSKLGLDSERAIKAIKKYGMSSKIPFGAISTHVGCRHPPGLEVFEQSIRELVDFGRTLEKILGIELESVDIGGGFPPRYLLERNGYSIEHFSELTHTLMSKLASDPSLIVEPGRFLVGDAIICLATVIRKRKTSGQTWALLDVGINVLVPLGFTKYEIHPCVLSKQKKESLSIGGPLCQPNDEFVRNVEMYLGEGDNVAIFNAGAYTTSIAGHFGYPSPAMVKLDSGKSNVIKRRQTYDDIFSILKSEV